MAIQSNTAQLEQLIRNLNDPRNQAARDEIHIIQKKIQQLQRDPSAWQMGLDLLQHIEPQMRFFGALTLTIKINADWENDRIGEDRIRFNSLLESLVTSYLRLAAADEALFVLQKLCTTLVAVFQRTDSAWAFPLRHILACMIAGKYLQQDSIPPFSELLKAGSSLSYQSFHATLLLALTFSEEIDNMGGAGRSQHLQIRISNNAHDMLHLVHFSVLFTASRLCGQMQDRFGIYHLHVESEADHLANLVKLAMLIIPHWTSSIKPKSAISADGSSTPSEQFREIVEGLVCLFDLPSLSESTIEAFTSLEQTAHSLLRRLTPRYAEHIIRSSQATKWLMMLQAGDFDPDAMSYADYLETRMSQIDVTSPDYLRDPQNVEMLKQIQQLLRCHGVAGIDDLVCQIALEVLTAVVEGFGDWPEPCEFDESLKVLAAESCLSCLSKIRMPPEEMKVATQEWDTDDRAKFQNFRYDVQDFLQNSYGMLGPSLIEEVLKAVVDPSTGAEWTVFEANLFGLLAFSDTMASEPDRFDKYLEITFGCDTWRSALNSTANTPERVRQMMIKLIGENTGFLQRNMNSLVSSLDFLFESLHVTGSTTAASRAIFTLCDAERNTLVKALPQFMASLGTVSDLDNDARNRIFGGVSAIIQAQPSEEEKISPLTQILAKLEADTGVLVATTNMEDELVIKAADLIYTLAAIGRGLRSPTESHGDESPEKSNNKSFWTAGEGAPVQQMALRIYTTLLEKFDGDRDSYFVEAACDFLRSALPEDHPSPFRMSSTVTTTILCRYIYSSVPQPDIVMGTISSYLAVTEIEDPNNGFVMILSRTLSVIQDVLAQYQQQNQIVNSDFCAASLELVGRLLTKWGRVWLNMSEFQQSARIFVDIAIVLMEDPDTLTRRAAASFFSAMLDASGKSYITSDQQAASNMGTLLQEHGPRILGAVIRLLGGECARSELETLTEPLKKFVQKQSLMASRLLKEAVKAENGVLTAKALSATNPEQRARFVAQVEMLRGARKTNEIVRDFWVACKGSSFGYVT